ncbi:hypothetical protein GCM10010123_02520 [Pilimelia anulata]|uniref:Uncharacterized protein n=1 Tax=Pilimelia anulata TaxID=53371 RepID=A0A8J3B6F5_9ACTN|nr:hypothetical protein GCM10010123_02520 [Pilimelia anulata]
MAGAVALVSSVAEERGRQLSPQQVRELLVRTGQPQVDPTDGNIGPMPDLKKAIAAL